MPDKRTDHFYLRLLAWFVLAITLIYAATTPLLQAASSIDDRRPFANKTPAVPIGETGRNGVTALSAGQPQPDSHTIALYHFDTDTGATVQDATGRYNATLPNGGSYAPELYNNTLYFNGNGQYLAINNPNVIPVAQGTIDLYVDFKPYCNAFIHSNFPLFTAYAGGQPVMRMRSEGFLLFEVLTASGWQTAISGINPCRYFDGEDQSTNFGIYGIAAKWPYETWRFHHVAGTWGPRGVEIWADGILHGVGVKDVNHALDDSYNTWHAYWCNPQDQIGYPTEVPNPLYPVCRTPVPGVVPTLGYGGGLNASDSFRLGCDLTNCFMGRVDELRISDIQRSFTIAVVPTVTPLPTWTPVPLTNEYVVDADTIALYHFNSAPPDRVVLDATGQYNGNFSGDAQYTANGRYGAGVYLNGLISFDGYPALVSIPYVYAAPEGSVEAWIKPQSTTGAFAILDEQSRMYLGVPPGSSTLRFGIDNGTDMLWTDSGISLSALANCWHHVAGTWGSRGIELWVDGILRSGYAYTGAPNALYQPGRYPVGCDLKGNCLTGSIDEMRFSKIQRVFTSVRAPVRSANAARQPVNANSVFLPLVVAQPTLPAPACPFGF